MDTQTKLTVPEIVCGGCAASIEKALGTAAGVRRVVVDVAEKSVSVEHDERAISREQIAERLDDIGFSVE